MNPSYLNGPLHESAKQFRMKELKAKILNGDHPSLSEGINILRWAYFLIRYQWTNPDGPVFIVKLWMLIMDGVFGRLYSFNQDPICRSSNHSSVLSKKQNIGWLL